MTKKELRTDPQIAELLAPLTKDEMRGLLESIQEEGVRDPIVVWKGHDIIVDGHNRYKICNDYDYPFETVERDFEDIDEVLAWVIKNQIGKRNVTEEQRVNLIGRLYSIRKKGHGGEREGAGRKPEGYVIESSGEALHLNNEPRTDEVVAKEVGVGSVTVRKYFQRYEVKQEIAEKTSPAVVLEVVRQPDKVTTAHLAVLNVQLDTDPNAVEAFVTQTPFQRSKLAALVRGTAYLERLESRSPGDNQPAENSLRALSEKFKVSKRQIQRRDRDFAVLVTKTEALDSDLADWIMNSRQFPIERAGDLLAESREPNLKMLWFVRDLMEGGSGEKKVGFNDAITRWTAFEKARQVSKDINATVEESDRKVAEMFGGSSSMCFLPNVRELYCDDCKWGFDTYLPEPGPVSCPYCKGDRISNRAEDWSPRRR